MIASVVHRQRALLAVLLVSLLAGLGVAGLFTHYLHPQRHPALALLRTKPPAPGIEALIAGLPPFVLGREERGAPAMPPLLALSAAAPQPRIFPVAPLVLPSPPLELWLAALPPVTIPFELSAPPLTAFFAMPTEPPPLGLMAASEPAIEPMLAHVPKIQLASIIAPAQIMSALPAWKKYAVPASAHRPMVAVIIDDMGLDRRRSARIVALPAPLTISFMTYANHLDEQSLEARARGHELMMHMPMQPLSSSFDAGPDVLMAQMPPTELRRRVVSDLDRFQGYVGVNNHMGSRFTADAPGMRIVMEELHKRGLLFIDSMTTDKSVGIAVAREASVPAAARNVFIDDDDDVNSIAAQLQRAENEARRGGSVIAIGHPRDNTIAALAAWLPGLEKKGLTQVPVTAVVKQRLAAQLDPTGRPAQ